MRTSQKEEIQRRLDRLDYLLDGQRIQKSKRPSSEIWVCIGGAQYQAEELRKLIKEL